MSNKCDVCKRSEEGDGGSAFPCNLCSENDTIKALKKHRNELWVAAIMCATINITLDQLDHEIKNYFEEVESHE